MKTTIVCGILGAGKTTFIKNLLNNSGEKTVVLVNDFGDIGIDGEVLSVDGIETIELKSGCVCCSLRFDLIRTIEKIIEEFNPDSLYIEPSGVASPSSVLEVLGLMKINNVTVVGVLDVTGFIEDYKSEKHGWFFKSQVQRSDILLVNKTDLVSEDITKGTIRLIESLNQHALIVPTINATIDPALLSIKAIKHKPDLNTESPLKFYSLSLNLPDKLEFEHLKSIFERILSGDYGEVIRAKALVQTDKGPYNINLASGQIDFSKFDRTIKDNRLVIIGTDLKEDDIKGIYKGPMGPVY